MPYLVTESGIVAVHDWPALGYSTRSISLARARFYRLRGFPLPKPHYRYDPAAFAAYRASVGPTSPFNFGATYERFTARARAELAATYQQRQGGW